MPAWLAETIGIATQPGTKSSAGCLSRPLQRPPTSFNTFVEKDHKRTQHVACIPTAATPLNIGDAKLETCQDHVNCNPSQEVCDRPICSFGTITFAIA